MKTKRICQTHTWDSFVSAQTAIGSKGTWPQVEADHIRRLTNRIVMLLGKSKESAFTLDPLTFRELPIYERGIFPEIYISSLDGHELIFSGIPQSEEIRKWLSTHYEVLCVGGNYIGMWAELGEYYLDISCVIMGRARALAFARRHRQIAIYHPYSGQSLPVDFSLRGSEPHITSSKAPFS